MEPKTQYWLNLTTDDLRVAGYLFNKKEYLYCLFFCQQAAEKAIKAIYYEKFNKTPPKKHDLEALAKAAGILSRLDERQLDLLDTLSFYYIESRYSEDRETLAKDVTRKVTKDTLKQTGEIIEWLKSILSQA